MKIVPALSVVLIALLISRAQPQTITFVSDITAVDNLIGLQTRDYHSDYFYTIANNNKI